MRISLKSPFFAPYVHVLVYEKPKGRQFVTFLRDRLFPMSACRYHIGMNDFYAVFAEHYDDVFLPEPEIVSFLAMSMQGRTELLDLACGTGTYAIELASRGFRVTGVDNEERMIELAKAKRAAPPTATGEEATALHGKTDFFHADMTGASDGDAVFLQRYDGAYCIGNSLPHLSDIAEMEKALSVWRGALDPGGVLVVQVVNFSRFISGGSTDLPAIERDELTFTRRYVVPPGNGSPPDSVCFEATLTLRSTGQVYQSSVPLLVIDKELLTGLIQRAGFSDLELFGNYDGREYDEKNSFLLICRARAC